MVAAVIDIAGGNKQFYEQVVAEASSHVAGPTDNGW
jgi:hypothetical protein